MSANNLVREQLYKLVSWGDELAELQSLNSFLGDAVVHVAEGDGFEPSGDSLKGLYLYCAELSRRVSALKGQIQCERQRLYSLLQESPE